MLQQSIQDIDSRKSDLITENNNLQTVKKLLEHEIEQLKSSLFETNDKISILNDGNKIILQEKAMLQEQFKPLQGNMFGR